MANAKAASLTVLRRNGWSLRKVRRTVRRTFKYGLLRVGLAAGRGTLALAPGRRARVISAVMSPLRRSVRANMERGFGVERVTDEMVDEYFQRLGWYAAHALEIYHRGLNRSKVMEEIVFDESIRHVEAGLASGRGLVLAIPHVWGYGILLGAINARYPVTAITRESKDRGHTQVKSRWYNESLGVPTVVRSSREPHAVVIRCLNAMGQGRCLGVTPDLMFSAAEGVQVQVFGRPAYLKAGLVAMAQQRGAAVIPVWPRWHAGDEGGEGSVVVQFGEAMPVPSANTQEDVHRRGLQAWCDAFESWLEKEPGGWMFWLDKRWERALEAPVTGGSE